MATWKLSEWFGSWIRPRRGPDPAQDHRDDSDPAVTIDAAMQLGTVWACVRLLSETIGTLPVGVYQKDSTGGRLPATEHPLYALLHDSPNADQTAAEFFEAIVACLCLWGNFYAEKDINGAGEVASLIPLRPDLTTVFRDKNGARRYRVTEHGKTRELSEDKVFHVRGFGTGGDVGLSPVGYARKTLNMAMTTDDAARSAFRNGVRASGFLVVPGKPTPDQKLDLRKTFIDPVTGAGNTARAGVLEQGMDWKDIKGIPPEDLQLLEGRAFNVEELCRWFRVPPFMIGHTEKSSSWGTGLEQQMIGFLTFSLRPYLTRIEQAVKKQLLKAKDRASTYIEFNLEGLLRADSQGRAALYSTFAQNGISTRNEIRGRENWLPMPGGDVLTVQSNLLPLDQLGQATKAGEGQAKSAMQQWLFGGDIKTIIADCVAAAFASRRNDLPPDDGASNV